MPLPSRKKLPFRPISQIEHDDSENIPLVIVRCHYSGEKPATPQASWSRIALKSDPTLGECAYCHYVGKLIDGVLPEHGRHLDKFEQADAYIDNIGKLLGWKRWDDPVMYARAAATNRQNRLETIEEMVAVGMHFMAMHLAKRGASLETAAAVDKMMSYVVHDICIPGEDEDYPLDRKHPAPFFTEATLYPVLGKEAARTVLAIVGRVKRAVGGKG